MAEDKKTYFCDKCHRVLSSDHFFVSNNMEKYGENDGRLHTCKDCITMHVDNWDPETYMWILKEVDVPYIPDEWNKLLTKYSNRPEKVTGTTILGRYIGKMHLSQFKRYRWKDNNFLQEQADAKIRQTMQRQGYEEAQIQLALQEGRVTAPEKPEVDPTMMGGGSNQANLFSNESAEQLGLTEEDVRYLRLKWGNLYKPEEWVQLEQLYSDMMASYDIQTAGHKDNLKMLCKTSLKANQLIDLGDVDGYQKMQKAYDSLMKSGNFSAVQNKEDVRDYVDSVGELVAICEKDGFIPRYYVDEPKDKVDRVLQDLQAYTRSLIMDEMNLNVLIENAVKSIEADKEKENKPDAEDENGKDEDSFEESLFKSLDEEPETASTEDYEEFNDFLEEEDM